MKRLICLLMILVAVAGQAQTLTVGSKMFTESYVLGEIAKKTLEDGGFKVEHKQGMGATAILWGALKGGSIDAYPEYTGTVSEEILKRPGLDDEGLKAALKPLGIGMSPELGFNNTYALVMKREKAEKLGIKTISDLAQHPELKAGPTHEFLERKDGWKPLMAKYGVNLADVRGIQHALGYSAMNSGDIDIKDCYSTDAEIAKYDLVVLDDDKQFFPAYKAVFLYRLTIPEKAQKALDSLGGTIKEPLMIKMNAAAGESKDFAKAAQIYFSQEKTPTTEVVSATLTEKITGWTLRHLELVGLSLFFAILVGVPLGIVASKQNRLSAIILGVTGVIQTIPSLALLALLVPISFLGISVRTAIFALFLYSLLPIVRNTATGLASIALPIRESAEALGLKPMRRLLKIYLPLAMPTILAGIKTSAVINVGTATIAALIGAGGLGEPIISGLALNDNNTILQGAIPAAVLAIIVQLLFDLIEKAVVPRGLRIVRH
ncbi:glycine betaine ABC transporter substrate-binding protein [soil metagenome]